MDPAQMALRASTQEHLDIEDVKDGLVVLKDGGAALVISVTSINFDLLSEQEQEATIYAYASLLNSLTFPIQIVIRSQRKDISAYLNLLKETADKEKRELIKKQVIKYAEFVRDTVQKSDVMDKKFYLVIPMSPLEIGAMKSLGASVKPGKRKLPFAKSYILEKAKINLYPKRDHILRLLGRLGIKGHQLETQELIKLFFEIYNPESPGQQIIEGKIYQAPIMESTLPAAPAATAPPASVSSPAPAPAPIATPTPGAVPTNETIYGKINNLVNQETK